MVEVVEGWRGGGVEGKRGEGREVAGVTRELTSPVADYARGNKRDRHGNRRTVLRGTQAIPAAASEQESVVRVDTAPPAIVSPPLHSTPPHSPLTSPNSHHHEYRRFSRLAHLSRAPDADVLLPHHRHEPLAPALAPRPETRLHRWARRCGTAFLHRAREDRCRMPARLPSSPPTH